ncbi:hypothetical protein A2V55_01085 [Candidatus Woesebacteria bacterium RBG_19FT_COMBO_37_29]|uniref:Uncharacterized protein n=1 Tax=Candidatus Woesebacteria bacterium RBG_19FT_COMBO_37_29 TaxID=1802486 RepID=A0A1F7XMX8_9BACT|nr:MAG: hypothetical protein A2V55_01085 [Candidatus Woesebacteria bacterium RBG_19FT_COMBO_37_29]
MKRGFVNILVLVLFFIFIAFIVWQYILFKSESMSCEASSKFISSCSLGTYCLPSIKSGIVTGYCKPYLNFLFDTFNLRLPF